MGKLTVSKLTAEHRAILMKLTELFEDAIMNYPDRVIIAFGNLEKETVELVSSDTWKIFASVVLEDFTFSDNNNIVKTLKTECKESFKELEREWHSLQNRGK